MRPGSHPPLILAGLVLASLAACVIERGGRTGEAGDAARQRETHGPVTPTPVTLTTCVDLPVPAVLRCGEYEVFENRAARSGRKLALKIIVLPAESATPAPDPIFVVAGGPGQTVTEMAPVFWRSPLRNGRDLVLVDQRGSGDGHRLDCEIPGADADVAGHLAPLFDRALLDECRRALEQRADLRQYTTSAAMDDLDEVRAALGYGAINLYGFSYGTRAILTYLRRHPASARSAILVSAAPPAFRNPLHHARGAQDALDTLLAACEADDRCRNAYPTIRADLHTVVERLDREPATVTLTPRGGAGPVTVTISRERFGEALRVMMYGSEQASAVPFLVHRAAEGDFAPFAERALERSRGLRQGLRFGLLLSIVCSEDVPRISEPEIARETRGTLLGDWRVRQQISACAAWPRGDVPGDDAEPVRVPVPVLLVSGTYDPVTPPKWGEETARHLPHRHHIIVPRAHSPADPCLDAVYAAFLRAPESRTLDTSCVERMSLPRFLLPR